MSVGNTNLKTEFPLFDAKEEGQKLQISIEPICIYIYQIAATYSKVGFEFDFPKKFEDKI